MGRCPECGGWDTLAEEVVTEGDRFQPASSKKGVPTPEPESILSIETMEEPRISSGIPEFDRVLGGGIVADSDPDVDVLSGFDLSVAPGESAAAFPPSMVPGNGESGADTCRFVNLYGIARTDPKSEFEIATYLLNFVYSQAQAK